MNDVKQEPKALAAPSSYTTLRDVLAKQQASIAAVAPKHLTAERLTRIALSAISRNEKLLKCSPESLLRCVMDCAKLGLEPTGRIGGAHLVPYWNSKISKFEAQLITDYHGEMELARRSGLVTSIRAYVVYRKEHFLEHGGSFPKLEHVVCVDPDADRGEPIGAYAIAILKDGSPQWEYLNRNAIEARRDRSRAKDSGPWVTDTMAMWKKTAVRALCNYLPQSVEQRQHSANEEAVDMDYGPIVDVDAEPIEPPPAESRVSGLTERLKREKKVKEVIQNAEEPSEEELPPLRGIPEGEPGSKG